MEHTFYMALRRRHLSYSQLGVLMIGAVIAYAVQCLMKKADIGERTIKLVTTVIMAVTALIMLFADKQGR